MDQDLEHATPLLMAFRMESGVVEFLTLTPSVKSRLMKQWQEENLPSPPISLTGSQIFDLTRTVELYCDTDYLKGIQAGAFEDPDAYDEPGGPQLVALRAVRDTVLRLIRQEIDNATRPGQVQRDS